MRRVQTRFFPLSVPQSAHSATRQLSSEELDRSSPRGRPKQTARSRTVPQTSKTGNAERLRIGRFISDFLRVLSVALRVNSNAFSLSVWLWDFASWQKKAPAGVLMIRLVPLLFLYINDRHSNILPQFPSLLHSFSQVPSLVQLHTTLAMESKYSADIDVEIQVRESDSTDGRDTPDTKTNALVDEWDAPDNQENPRNWSSCERYTTALTSLRVELMYHRS